MARGVSGGRGASPGRFGAAQEVHGVTHLLGCASARLACTCAVARFAVRHSPRWLLPVLAVCASIPGPVDELFVLAVVMVPVLRSRENRAELAGSVRKAWND